MASSNSDLLTAGIRIAGTVKVTGTEMLLYCLTQYQHPKAFTSRNKSQLESERKIGGRTGKPVRLSSNTKIIQGCDSASYRQWENSSVRVQNTRIYISVHSSPLLSCFRDSFMTAVL